MRSRGPGSIDAQVDARLARLGLVLPTPPRPAGKYQPAIVRNGVGFVSGQFPFQHGVLELQGRIGEELSEQEGAVAARLAALNVLAQIRALEGGFDAFGGLLRVEGYVASRRGWTHQPRVLDAASELFVEVLGEDLGSHARAAFAVEQLPLNAPVELCVSFATRVGG